VCGYEYAGGVVGSADLADPGKFLEVKNGSVMRGFGEECTYLGLLIRVARWRSHQYPDTLKCFLWIELFIRLRYRLATNNSNTGENAEMTVQETVTFYSDTLTPSASIPQEFSKDSNLDYSLKEDRVHDIISILKRPVILTEFLWSVTDVSNTVLATYANPTQILNHTMNAEKVKGFVGIKAKMVVRLQVNAQRFQQGRLLLHYFPMYNHQTSNRRNTAGNLVFKTQQPRIDFDISTDTEVLLEIPFVYPFEYYNLKGQFPDLGSFFVTVYSPLISPTGDTNCDVVCWGHLEDVEVVFPTVLVPQVGGGRKSLATQELQASGPGPISGLLGRVSKAATIMGEIPLLSSVAFPAAWFSSVASRAASAMGWSNPSQSAPASRMQNSKTPFMNNANGIDNSMKLALMADNEVEVLPGFSGTNIDELNLRHLSSIPTFIKTFNWTTAQATGVLLWSSNVTPNAISNDITAATLASTLAVKLPSPFAFFANFFTYWRGSICFTIKVVKTEFHSGRLMFTWTPDNTVDPLFVDLDPVYKEILDLRHSNEFSVCIPFASSSPWKNVNGTTSAISTGRVGLYVLNALRGPATVSTSVQLLIEANGGPDIEFSAPVETQLVPTMGVFTPQCGGEIFRAQVLGDDATDCGNAVSMPIADTIASSSNNTGGFSAIRYCSGESVVSMRQLMKRSCPKYTSTPTIGSIVTINPFIIALPNFVVATDPVTANDVGVDYFDILGSCFAFSRGGVRWKTWSQGGGIITYKTRLTLSTITTFVSVAVAGVKSMLSSVVTSVNVMTGAIEIEVPQYGISHMRIDRVAGYTGTTSLSPFNTPLCIEFTEDALTTPVPVFHYRQASDDTDFGFFYGVLPMIPSTGTFSSTMPW
jgi:hypothetical protein